MTNYLSYLDEYYIAYCQLNLRYLLIDIDLLHFLFRPFMVRLDRCYTSPIQIQSPTSIFCFSNGRSRFLLVLNIIPFIFYFYLPINQLQPFYWPLLQIFISQAYSLEFVCYVNYVDIIKIIYYVMLSDNMLCQLCDIYQICYVIIFNIMSHFSRKNIADHKNC